MKVLEENPNLNAV